MADQNEKGWPSRARVPEANHAELPVIRLDAYLAISLTFIKNPTGEPQIGQKRLQLAQSCHIHVGRRQLQFLSDLSDLVDKVSGGTITTSNLILLNDLKPLCWDPIVTLEQLRDLSLLKERA